MRFVWKEPAIEAGGSVLMAAKEAEAAVMGLAGGVDRASQEFYWGSMAKKRMSRISDGLREGVGTRMRSLPG